MLLEGARSKIYVGRTGSIRRRVTDYALGFQLHSPTTSSCASSRKPCAKPFPAATLELYFAPAPKAECGERERSYIRMLRPLVNTLPPAAAERTADTVRYVWST
ncbi:MAG TPA: hypothetical protein VHE78_08200 [Gemmatimonadaceae bacterium]|nr:hypothetical protein [Gemmatimonadaceae bacterium]